MLLDQDQFVFSTSLYYTYWPAQTFLEHIFAAREEMGNKKFDRNCHSKPQAENPQGRTFEIFKVAILNISFWPNFDERQEYIFLLYVVGLGSNYAY